MKFGNSCIGENFIYITLLHAEKSGNINLHQQTVLLKRIYDFRIEIFMKK